MPLVGNGQLTFVSPGKSYFGRINSGTVNRTGFAGGFNS